MLFNFYFVLFFSHVIELMSDLSNKRAMLKVPVFTHFRKSQ